MMVTSSRMFGEERGLRKFPLELVFSDSKEGLDQSRFIARDHVSGLVSGHLCCLRFGMRYSRNGFEGFYS